MAAPASPDSANVTYGAGLLWFAPLGTAEPATLVAAWPAGWVKLGYTKEGHQESHQLTITDVEVAESFDPIKRVTTKRDTRVAFALAEMTAAHLKVVLNGGTITPGVGFSTYEPPDVGAEVRLMLGWDSDDELERVIWRQCIQAGNLQIARRKGGDYATLPAEFALEVPTGGAKIFAHMFDATRA
jgi:hypothetical protein